MSKLAIRIENVSKRYHIGRQKQHDTLIHSLADTIVAPARRTYRLLRGRAGSAAELDETFWALRDVNLDVQQGEVVGVIGHNGAGKSTLLKILSQITEPTSGRILLWGRVASLLEVGTGFHPELTGRENVYLNGAILGMRQQEIDRKFDEIVAFSEVEQFIDTPTKHYSSGMTVRLAFAVAAHLEPEILLVDEVLAVGDVTFQRKSLGKMNDVSKEGRTVLFVSHNLGAVSNLCERCVLLDHGQVITIGTPSDVIPQYLSQNVESHGHIVLEIGNPEVAIIHSMGIQNEAGEFSVQLDIKQDFYVWIHYSIYKPLQACQVGVAIYSMANGVPILATTHADLLPLEETTMQPGTYEAKGRIPGHYLNRGGYAVTPVIWGISSSEPRKAHAIKQQALNFFIVETGSVASNLFDNRSSMTIPLLEWEVTPVK